MTNTFFLKYRHRWSSGIQQDWDYRLLTEHDASDADSLNAIIDEIKAEHWDQPEAYRGIDHHIVSRPDPDWIDNTLDTIDLQIKALQNYRSTLLQLAGDPTR